jgi:hypothetical protein
MRGAWPVDVGLSRSKSDRLLANILTGWKRVSGHAIISLIGEPKPFWMSENYDHIVRREKQLANFQRYIAENPSKAGLEAGTWTHWECP